MIKTILTIVICVSIFGILVFSIVRQTMQKKINELVENEKKEKQKKIKVFFHTFLIVSNLKPKSLLQDHN